MTRRTRAGFLTAAQRFRQTMTRLAEDAAAGRTVRRHLIDSWYRRDRKRGYRKTSKRVARHRTRR